MSTTGNIGLDALADAIADRVIARMKAEDTDRPALLTVAQAATYLSRSQSAVRAMLAKGVLPCVRQGGRVMLRRSEVDRAIEKQAEGA
jgi:excisionase family DNA binding protein